MLFFVVFPILLIVAYTSVQDLKDRYKQRVRKALGLRVKSAAPLDPIDTDFFPKAHDDSEFARVAITVGG